MRRRDFDECRVGRRERGLARILGILPVEQRADPREAPAPLDEPRAPLHEHAAERAPVLRVHVHGERDPRIGAEVQDLPAVVPGLQGPGQLCRKPKASKASLTNPAEWAAHHLRSMPTG